ncbi:MAG TPA: sigma-E factor negative regulatory protein [Steroidobacteraceae bacterium]|jgi:sigma-E factor negative regulatory protein RseA|nr:sigma-E factor negative regulatory protein [Steroidobacteraceae bacterium]
MNEELDSQLSAMFDDELPPAECELLARRLSRDEQLKARWGRYAVVGAVIRAERGVRLNAPLAGRVSAVLLTEPSLAAQSAPRSARRGGVRWWQPVAAGGLAASVAAVSILWLRAQLPPGTPAAAALASAQPAGPRLSGAGVVPASVTGAAAPGDRYVVPRIRPGAVLVPSTELANYVVAHSMFSSPVARRNLLSAFMTSEPAAAAAEELQDDVKSAAH